jgi:hypothetical protein
MLRSGSRNATANPAPRIPRKVPVCCSRRAHSHRDDGCGTDKQKSLEGVATTKLLVAVLDRTLQIAEVRVVEDTGK